MNSGQGSGDQPAVVGSAVITPRTRLQNAVRSQMEQKAGSGGTVNNSIARLRGGLDNFAKSLGLQSTADKIRTSFGYGGTKQKEILDNERHSKELTRIINAFNQGNKEQISSSITQLDQGQEESPALMHFKDLLTQQGTGKQNTAEITKFIEQYLCATTSFASFKASLARSEERSGAAPITGEGSSKAAGAQEEGAADDGTRQQPQQSNESGLTALRAQVMELQHAYQEVTKILERHDVRLTSKPSSKEIAGKLIRMDSMSTDLGALQPQLIEMQEKIEALESFKAQLKPDQELHERFDQVTGTIEGLEESATQNASDLEQVKSEIQALTEKIQSDKSISEAEIQRLTDVIKQKIDRTNQQQIDDEIARLTAAIDVKTKDLDGQFTKGLQTLKAELEAQIMSVTSEIEGMKARLEGVETQLSQSDKKHDDAEQKLTEQLASLRDSLANDIKEAKEKIEKLQSEIAQKEPQDADEEVTTLPSLTDQLHDGKITELEEQLSVIAGQLDEIQGQDTKGELEALRSQISELDQSKKQVQEALEQKLNREELDKKIAALEEQGAKVTQSITALESKLNAEIRDAVEQEQKRATGAEQALQNELRINAEALERLQRDLTDVKASQKKGEERDDQIGEISRAIETHTGLFDDLQRQLAQLSKRSASGEEVQKMQEDLTKQARIFEEVRQSLNQFQKEVSETRTAASEALSLASEAGKEIQELRGQLEALAAAEPERSRVLQAKFRELEAKLAESAKKDETIGQLQELGGRVESVEEGLRKIQTDLKSGKIGRKEAQDSSQGAFQSLSEFIKSIFGPGQDDSQKFENIEEMTMYAIQSVVTQVSDLSDRIKLLDDKNLKKADVESFLEKYHTTILDLTQQNKDLLKRLESENDSLKQSFQSDKQQFTSELTRLTQEQERLKQQQQALEERQQGTAQALEQFQSEVKSQMAALEGQIQKAGMSSLEAGEMLKGAQQIEGRLLREIALLQGRQEEISQTNRDVIIRAQQINDALSTVQLAQESEKLGQDGKITALKDEILELSTQLSLGEASKAEQAQKLQALEERLSEALDDNQSLKEQFSQWRSALSERDEQIAQIQARSTVFEAETREQLQGFHAHLSAELSKKADQSALEEFQLTFSSTAQKIQEELQTQRVKFEEDLLSKLEEAQLAFRIELDKKADKTAVSALEKTVAELAANLEKMKAEHAAKMDAAEQAHRASLKEEEGKTQGALELLRAELERSKAEIQTLQDELRDIQEKLRSKPKEEAKPKAGPEAPPTTSAPGVSLSDFLKIREELEGIKSKMTTLTEKRAGVDLGSLTRRHSAPALGAIPGSEPRPFGPISITPSSLGPISVHTPLDSTYSRDSRDFGAMPSLDGIIVVELEPGKYVTKDYFTQKKEGEKSHTTTERRKAYKASYEAVSQKFPQFKELTPYEIEVAQEQRQYVTTIYNVTQNTVQTNVITPPNQVITLKINGATLHFQNVDGNVIPSIKEGDGPEVYFHENPEEFARIYQKHNPGSPLDFTSFGRKVIINKEGKMGVEERGGIFRPFDKEREKSALQEQMQASFERTDAGMSRLQILELEKQDAQSRMRSDKGESKMFGGFLDAIAVYSGLTGIDDCDFDNIPFGVITEKGFEKGERGKPIDKTNEQLKEELLHTFQEKDSAVILCGVEGKGDAHYYAINKITPNVFVISDTLSADKTKVVSAIKEAYPGAKCIVLNKVRENSDEYGHANCAIHSVLNREAIAMWQKQNEARIGALPDDELSQELKAFLANVTPDPKLIAAIRKHAPEEGFTPGCAAHQFTTWREKVTERSKALER